MRFVVVAMNEKRDPSTAAMIVRAERPAKALYDENPDSRTARVLYKATLITVAQHHEQQGRADEAQRYRETIEAISMQQPRP